VSTPTENVKTFRDLMTEVQQPGLCGKCGGCVSFCSAGQFSALTLATDGSPTFLDEERCLSCGICYLICPQTDVLDEELADRFGWRSPIGQVRRLASAQTTDEALLGVCTDGGVVTSLLHYALERSLIQAAVVAKKTGPFTRTVTIATSKQQITEAAGSHFDESRHLPEAGQQYSTFSPTVREIRHLRDRDIRRVAIVGTPCQIRTIRKMQILSVLPSETVALTIGLLCMESFSFDEAARKELEELLGVPLAGIRKLNVRDDVIITTDDDRTLHVPFYVVDRFARPACLACAHFANVYSDISCGGLGSPEGYTTVVVRSSAGEKVYNGARNDRIIRELRFANAEDRRNHTTYIMGKLVSFAAHKEERAQHRREEAVGA
jgi:coenzyme F420 hydrogenase subunit beta